MPSIHEKQNNDDVDLIIYFIHNDVDADADDVDDDFLSENTPTISNWSNLHARGRHLRAPPGRSRKIGWSALSDVIKDQSKEVRVRATPIEDRRSSEKRKQLVGDIARWRRETRTTREMTQRRSAEIVIFMMVVLSDGWTGPGTKI